MVVEPWFSHVMDFSTFVRLETHCLFLSFMALFWEMMRWAKLIACIGVILLSIIKAMNAQLPSFLKSLVGL